MIAKRPRWRRTMNGLFFSYWGAADATIIKCDGGWRYVLAYHTDDLHNVREMSSLHKTQRQAKAAALLDIAATFGEPVP